MSDPNPKLLKLAERLLAGTKEGKIPWTAADDFEYVYSTPSSSVSITSRDNDGSLPYVIKVYDAIGHEVDSEASHDETDRRSFTQRISHAVLRDLYQSARRVALNIDPILDQLLTDVDRRIGD